MNDYPDFLQDCNVLFWRAAMLNLRLESDSNIPRGNQMWARGAGAVKGARAPIAGKE